jgi:hypothetical protein
MNNKKLQSSSAIFIAAVLVAGVIAIASPVTSFAEGSDRYYKEDKKHDSYDPYKEKKYDSYDPYKEKKYDSYDPYKEKKYDSYDPYKEEKKYEKPGWKYNKAECSVSNFNIGEVTQFEAEIVNSWIRQTENDAGASNENINSIAESMDASIGIGSNNNGIERNGGGGIELEIENICLNFGDNENFGTVGSVP